MSIRLVDPELDAPLSISEAAVRARKWGVEVSAWTLWRLARDGDLPVSKTGRRRTTLRAVIEALSPEVADA